MNREPQLPRPLTALRLLTASGLEVKHSPNVLTIYIPGLISCAGVTVSVGITRHARPTQMAGLSSSQSHSLVAHSYVYLLLYMYMYIPESMVVLIHVIAKCLGRGCIALPRTAS